MCSVVVVSVRCQHFFFPYWHRQTRDKNTLTQLCFKKQQQHNNNNNKTTTVFYIIVWCDILQTGMGKRQVPAIVMHVLSTNRRCLPKFHFCSQIIFIFPHTFPRFCVRSWTSYLSPKALTYCMHWEYSPKSFEEVVACHRPADNLTLTLHIASLFVASNWCKFQWFLISCFTPHNLYQQGWLSVK